MHFDFEEWTRKLMIWHQRPDWRWHHALKLAEAPPPEDELWNGPFPTQTEQIVKYLRAEKSGWRAQPPKGFQAARALYESNPRVRLPIEGFILAGCEPGIIARCIRRSPEALDWFERLFFCAREWRRDPLWVTVHLTGPALPELGDVVPRHPIYRHLRRAAYEGGLRGFEECLAALHPLADGAAAGENRRKIRRSLLIDMFFCVADARACEEAAGRATRALEQESKRPLTPAEATGVYEAAIDDILLRQHGADVDRYEFWATGQPTAETASANGNGNSDRENRPGSQKRVAI